MRNREKLAACFKALGMEPSVDTFSERKKMQKITYLLERFAVDLGFSPTFSWYVYGPYSPALTKALFEIRQNPPKRVPQLSKADGQRIAHLKKFLERDIESADKVELLASLDFIMRIGKQRGASDDDIINALEQRKPFYRHEDVLAAWTRLNSLPKP
jgi:uncharacterized protein YwgA